MRAKMFFWNTLGVCTLLTYVCEFSMISVLTIAVSHWQLTTSSSPCKRSEKSHVKKPDNNDSAW